jgi:pseudaminic acid cytidylyltransferase
MDNCLAIITARGGSKRIPKKNVKEFLGRPILDYSIKAALESNIFSIVMVSTDDAEIGAVAKTSGAEVPFMRSEKNSNDFAVTADVIFEVINSYKKLGKEFEYVCCIYPTAPFVTAAKLKRALQMIKESGADGIFPVSEFSFPILRSLKIDSANKVSFNWPEHELTRSQDLEKAYQDSGQFYFLRVSTFLADPRLVSKNTLGLVVPNTEVQDIDNEEDWKLAEIKYSFLQHANG